MFGKLQIIVYFCQLKLIFEIMATYYIVENYQQAGPFTLEQLSARGITPETSVWTEGMANWTPASQVSELQCLFVPQPPISPEPSYESSSAYSGSSSSSSSSDEYVPMPKDYKMQAIILIAASVFCCGACGGIVNLILGILSLVEANKVEGLYRTGSYLQAQEASNKAGKYFKIGLILLIVGLVLEIIFLIVYYGAVIVSAVNNY